MDALFVSAPLLAFVHLKKSMNPTCIEDNTKHSHPAARFIIYYTTMAISKLRFLLSFYIRDRISRKEEIGVRQVAKVTAARGHTPGCTVDLTNHQSCSFCIRDKEIDKDK